MLNAGRVALAVAGVIAVASGAGLVAAVATPGALAVGSTTGYIASCFDSSVGRSGYAGIYLGNEGTTTITLDDVRVLDSEGIAVDGSWTLHNWRDGDTNMMFGTVETIDDSVPWADREPVRGTSIDPGEELSLVLHLTLENGETDAAVRDLVVDYANPFGLATSARSHAVVGFTDSALGDDSSCGLPDPGR